jgi:hypothetical protein
MLNQAAFAMVYYDCIMSKKEKNLNPVEKLKKPQKNVI